MGGPYLIFPALLARHWMRLVALPTMKGHVGICLWWGKRKAVGNSCNRYEEEHLTTTFI